MKKVAVVGTVGLPACYGGFESLVENLTKNNSGQYYYQIFCSAKAYENKLSFYNDSELHYLPLNANGAQSIFYDILSFVKCWHLKPDVVLVLGVSGCIFLPVFKLFSKARVVTNIDGLEWKRDKWGKAAKAFLKLSERFAVHFSDAVITDNKAISDYVSDEYGFSSATIAYGGDHALRPNIATVISGQKFSLGLCRIEPENNVHVILEAFRNSEYMLKFIGNWNSSAFGRALKAKYQNEPNIELLDPIYDLDKLFKIRSECSVYIHGHSAGGTNPSLVEMMHFGVPIFAFDCDFNRYSTENKAQYFKSSEELQLLLMGVDESILNENALDMKEIAERRYTWIEISKSYEAIY